MLHPLLISIYSIYSCQIKGDKLFFEAYNINPNFSFKYLNKKIIVNLLIKRTDKHFLYYLVPLLEIILNDIENLN